MTLLRSFAAVVVCSLCVSSVQAQANADRAQTMSGVRAVGMGGAFTAVADDATAISWNPAGLSSVRSVELTYAGNFRLLQTDPRFDAPDYSYSSVQLNTSSAPVNFASLVIPGRLFGLRYSAGIAYRALHDLGHSEELKSYYENGSAQAMLHEGTTRRGGMWAISPSLGLTLHDRVRVGATVSALVGKTTIERFVTLEGAVPTPGTSRASTTTSGYRGMPLDLGILVHLTQRIHIGARHSGAYDRVSTSTGNPRSRVAVPASASVGIVWRRRPGRHWAFDVRHEPWKKALIYNDETGAVLGPAGEHDITSYHFGYEAVTSFGARRVGTRFGLFTKPTAFSDDAGKQIVGAGLSVGRGWSGTRAEFDLALTYLRFGEHARNQSSFGDYSVVDQEIKLSAGLTLRFPRADK